MRAKFQVLILPYRILTDKIEYAILKRSDTNVWQGISGGGEGNELPIEAAKREAYEELGIVEPYVFGQLDSIASIPVIHFKDHLEFWGSDTFVIPEYSFYVKTENIELKLSNEHTEYKWCSFETAVELLQWDSNKVALWELNERIKKYYKINAMK